MGFLFPALHPTTRDCRMRRPRYMPCLQLLYTRVASDYSYSLQRPFLRQLIAFPETKRSDAKEPGADCLSPKTQPILSALFVLTHSVTCQFQRKP